MVNSDNNQPWYPYYVHFMLGNNLGIGDPIVDSTSSSDDVRSLTWIHNGMLNILLICKVNQSRTVHLQGFEARLNSLRIDSTVPWETPSIQTDVINSTEPLVIKGYTVALFQTPVTP
jgi:hypothetical protein